ncbi:MULTISPECIES: hypothetical protein [unclassified Streptomyces]|uniref:hypothetical protein n=1 Tax=unclassified Streptomyces TaxID=2593676 RepID=UPI002E176846|nr:MULTISPECIES: hypothetical protein [unclassified Streptomyces]
MNRRTTAAGLLVAAALALTACSSGTPDKADHPSKLDDAAKLACDDFAKDYKAAQTSSARLDLANKVNKWAKDSQTNGIADNGKVLARGANGSDGAWKIGADSFAQSCLDAGWEA